LTGSANFSIFKPSITNQGAHGQHEKARQGLVSAIETIEEGRLERAIQHVIDVYYTLEKVEKELFSIIIVEQRVIYARPEKSKNL
jgi:hypothetical protein